MVAGAIIRIIGQDYQNIFLTHNPQISFFKTVYKRHTNFAIETHEQPFYSPLKFGKTIKARLDKQRGDLISNITLHLKIPSLNTDYAAEVEENATTVHSRTKYKNGCCACPSCIASKYSETTLYGWVNSLGHAINEHAQIEINGKVIDRQYGEWLEIWTEVSQTSEKRAGYYEMINKVDPTSFSATTFLGDADLYIPLNFFFCRNIGLALPILSLYYSSVEIAIKLRPFKECWVVNKSGAASPEAPDIQASLLVEYVYLDLDERKKFYKGSHIYLIEQVGYSGEFRTPTPNQHVKLDLSSIRHPTKELFWVLQRTDVTGKPKGVYSGTTYPIGNDWFNFSPFKYRQHSRIMEAFDYGTIRLGGQECFSPRYAKYFRLLQPYFYNTRVPINYIYAYSFGFKPEDLQPTGELNFGCFDSPELCLFIDAKRWKINPYGYTARAYGLNYNTFIITNGMGSTLFDY
jgi:hypothetical protein